MGYVVCFPVGVIWGLRGLSSLIWEKGGERLLSLLDTGVLLHGGLEVLPFRGFFFA